MRIRGFYPRHLFGFRSKGIPSTAFEYRTHHTSDRGYVTIPKKFNPEKIRNIGIIAHVDAGKTTTSERMLFYSGESAYLGDVDKGDTMLDYLKMERERGITINSAVITFCWRSHFLNLIDTPGHVDFTIEVERSVRVLDGSVIILDGVSGVQVQTETVWNQINRYMIPRIAYINKMDRDGASISKCIDSIEDSLRVIPLLVQIPIGVAKKFSGVVDLIDMETIEWDKLSLGLKMVRLPVDIQSQLGRSALKARQELVDNCASLDEVFMDYILNQCEDQNDNTNIPSPILKDSIRRITQGLKAIPIFIGSSLGNIGVQLLMDAIVEYLPPPSLRPLKNYQIMPTKNSKTTSQFSDGAQNATAPLPCNPSGPLVSQAFKIVHNQKMNQMITYCRVYSGILSSNKKLFNVNKNCEERCFRISRVYADRLLDLDHIICGDIGAVSGLLHTETGDTLVGQNDPPYRVEGINIPQPVFWMSILANSTSEENHLRECLNSLQLEDPSFKWLINKDTSQWLMGGMGELHLEVVKDRLLNYYKVQSTTGPIQIAYKSTIKNDIKKYFSRDYIIGSKTESPAIELTLEKIHDEKPATFHISPTLFDNTANIPKKVKNNLIHSLSKAANASIASGTPVGFPLIKLKITLDNIIYDPLISIHSYKLCLNDAISNLVKEAGIQILEPIMKIEMQLNEEYMGKVISDLNFKRRATISQINTIEQGRKIIHCHAPLVELIGYSTELRSLSKGNATFTMNFDYNGELNSYIQESILENYQ